MRAEWLTAIVAQAQRLAGRRLDGPEQPDADDFARAAPAPALPLEHLILRGLASQVAEQRRAALTHRVPRPQPPATGVVARAIDLLRQHPERAWKVSGLARRVGTNRTDLERAFRRAAGCSVHAFLVRERIELAKQLLVTTADPLKTIVEEVGFKGVANFYRQFEKIVRVTPIDYRRRSR